MPTIKRPLSRSANLQKYLHKPELLKGKSATQMKAMLLQPEFSTDQQAPPGYPKHNPKHGGVDSQSLELKREKGKTERGVPKLIPRYDPVERLPAPRIRPVAGRKPKKL